MENFNEYKQNQRMYGGTAGRKMGIDYKGDNYILKFPGNLKELQMKNIQLSYSNSPVCEYIGSNIYQIFGIDVHETILGIRNDKVVTACKDFLGDADRLYEFDKIKVTFEPRFLDSNGHETNGVGLDLYEMIYSISVLSEQQKEFYVNIIRKRFDEVIIPVYEKLALREQNVVVEKERGR